MKTLPPAAARFLTALGYESIDALYDAIQADYPVECAEKRLATKLLDALDALRWAEPRIASALADLQRTTERLAGQAAEGLRVDAGWLAQGAQKVADATAEVDQLATQVKTYAFILRGKAL